jgi:hypothetical protein
LAEKCEGEEREGKEWPARRKRQTWSRAELQAKSGQVSKGAMKADISMCDHGMAMKGPQGQREREMAIGKEEQSRTPETKRQRDRQTERQTDRHTDRDLNRKTLTERERGRERDGKSRRSFFGAVARNPHTHTLLSPSFLTLTASA